jgi:hypothetical protein
LKDFQQAESDLLAAQGDHHVAKIALAASRNRLRILGCSDAQVAGLEKMEYIDAETIILAPIGGTVIQRKIGLRQYIAGGGTDPVFTVGDLASVWLIANVRESDAPKMKVGRRSRSRCWLIPIVPSMRRSPTSPQRSIRTHGAARCVPRLRTPTANFRLKCLLPFASFPASSG